MDIDNHLVLIKGEDRTGSINEFKYFDKRIYITFHYSDREYYYNPLNVEHLTKPQKICHNSLKISKNGSTFYGLLKILQFKNYYRIFFKNGHTNVFDIKELIIEENILTNEKIKNCFEYFKQVADNISIKTDDGKKILSNLFETIKFIGSNTALADYLNPPDKIVHSNEDLDICFPFGANLSQMSAVKMALTNKISIIKGPPGTGKTQTILNIIANAIIDNKSVAVVSNNNSATDNVFEKLKDHGFDFIAARLGNADNKKAFIEKNQTKYPDFNDYKYDKEEIETVKLEVNDLKNELKKMLTYQNEAAQLKQQHSTLNVEKVHFDDYFKDKYNKNIINQNFDKLGSKHILKLWIACQNLSDKNKHIGFWFKIKNILYYGIYEPDFYKRPMNEIISTFQSIYYRSKLAELDKEIKILVEKLTDYNFLDKLEKLSSLSRTIFKHTLYEKYKEKKERPVFTKSDLWKHPCYVNSEYPLILSTTYSIKTSLSKEHIYDYIIIDEASQVDLVTGVLSLSCARNVVIVGDLMQLPNVISNNDKKKIELLTKEFNLKDGYHFEKHSLLSSVCNIIPNVPTILLKEHYRCHPKIIEFCNKKFYNDELIIITEDNHEKDVFKIYKTVKGNHAREHFNQRKIDEIKQTVIPELQEGKENCDIGIIAPYRKQTMNLKNQTNKNFDISTVHKFQGREKDDIIISTVDNVITEFTDNPNMLNVAISRAKKRIRLVISDDEQNENTNIGDLIKYIQYNNFDVIKGQVHSVFDMLYKDYNAEKNEYLKKHEKISEFDSENIMYTLVKQVLSQSEFKKYGVVVHQPLNMLIRDLEKLTNKELRYAMNPATHLDFLIYNKMDKKPILAIEVDGYKYHKEGSPQSKRDGIKDGVLNKYGLSIIRFKTNGSAEKELLEKKLKDCSL